MTASYADNEIWHVVIADDMKRMNVDQLDDAFRLSLIDASTMVWKAGMKTWQRLGSVAGLDDDEPEEPTRRGPPPPPRPMARPVPKPPSPSRAPAAQYATTVAAFSAPAYSASTFPAPSLLAPVYSPPRQAPDPYVLPRRRAAIPSEVDFRRSSGGVRWGRGLLLLLLVTGGVLAAYRQNLLREGARRIGLETKYLRGERRVVSFVSASAPAPLKAALTRLALLPGPNAAALAPPSLPTPAVRSEPAPAAPPAPAAATPGNTPSAANEPELKTVSLDSLPVLRADSEPAPAKTSPALATPKSTTAAVQPAPKPAPEKRVVEKPAPSKRAEAPKARTEPSRQERAEVSTKARAPAPEPKRQPAPPPPANDSPLNAAIRSAIAADAHKK